MKIGVSTASLDPMHTEKALLELARLGVKNVEIFLNSTSELEGEVFVTIRKIISDYGLNVMALHPFSSPLETVFLFSSYDRRVTEIMDLYKRYFEKMNLLGAGIFVIHGAVSGAKCSEERYLERVSGLIDAGREFAVTVAQENVSYCRSGCLDFLVRVKEGLGRKAAFVLDLKQARRSDCDLFSLIDKLGDSIVHLHISDCDSQRDCLPVGAGNFDFAELFGRLRDCGYKGGGVVELYRENFGEISELSKSVEILDKML